MKLILYLLVLFFTLFKTTYYKEHVHFGYPPDEIAHLSYIQSMDTDHSFIPKFENMVMFNNKHSSNYLSHPSLYYKLEYAVYDKSDTLYHNVSHFRELSILIFLLSFMLLLHIGFSTKMDIMAHFIYLTVISSIPMYAYLGASISNDNLAILGGVLFIVALKRAIESNYNNWTYAILGLAIYISYFSKLTAAILIFFALIFFFIYIIFNKKTFQITKYQFLFLLLISIPVLYYQTYILTHFHAMVPTFNVTHPEEYLKSGFYVPEEFRQHLNANEWLMRMKQYIVEGWFNIHSHHSLIKPTIWGYIGILLLHILALITLLFPCNEKIKSYCIVGKISLLSLISLIIIQYIFSYKTHLSSGYMGGLQPRYLLPFMVAFAIMASLFVERFKQYLIFNIFIIIVCIHAIYSDFFYFLQYYQ